MQLVACETWLLCFVLSSINWTTITSCFGDIFLFQASHQDVVRIQSPEFNVAQLFWAI